MNLNTVWNYVTIQIEFGNIGPPYTSPSSQNKTLVIAVKSGYQGPLDRSNFAEFLKFVTDIWSSSL